MERAKDPRAETKPVGIWIRVSTEDQAQGESPQHHEMRGKSYAESRGWEVREVYRLEGVSGKSVMEHPEARRMMADVRRGRIAGLIFSKLARLARNTKELLDFSEFFREHGADLVSLQESIDTSTPHGRLFYTMIAAMAEWEREEIASRVVASIPVRARLGKPMGGIAPLGYRWVDKRLEINPEEAPLRRLIYELFKEHRRLKTVAEILNAAGHRGQNGRPFRDTTVEKLIVDPTAKGLRRASYTRLVKGQRVLKPEEEWIWVPCPAIVSEELWEQCNALLLKRRASRKPVAKRAVYAFAGYVYCACGEKMYVRSNTPKYVCKACHMKIPIVDLDNLFRDELREFTFSPEAIAAWLAQGAEVLAGQEELMDALFRERERLTKEADKLYRLYQEDALSVDGFREKHRPLEERLAALGGEIARLQGEIDFLKIRNVMEEDIVSQTRDLADKWQTMDIPEKRRVVESLLKRITIHKDIVDIDLANLPPLSEMMAKGPPIPDGGRATGEGTGVRLRRAGRPEATGIYDRGLMNLFALTRALIDIDSTTGREREVGDFLFQYLEDLVQTSGGAVEKMPVEEGRFNVFAAWGEPKVVLSTHMDTVPPFFPSSEDEEFIHGRGACDTKGGIAAMLQAARELLEEGVRGFGLLFVVGEETDSLGAQVANRQPRGSRYLIDGEPTENRLALGSKGYLYIRIEAEGRTAHSAYPELGESAIDRLLDVLARLRALPLPTDPILGETTLNIGTLAGGRASNVVADQARAEVTVRTVGPAGDLKRRISDAVHAVPEVRIAEIRETPAVQLGSLPGFGTTIVKYTTDIPRLGAWGEPFLLGPGSIHVAHTPGERVAKRDLLDAARHYRDMVRQLRDR